jgi:aspartyl-tRNA(Asn)/glutamyl-tRNA(Gln) amidotransferase subunit C
VYASVAGLPAALLEDHFEHPTRDKIAMKITLEDVEKVAKLARLDVSPAEKEAFAKQLSQILTHMETLKQYDTEDIEPTATVLGQVNVFREDIVRPSLPVEKALANAPEREADGFSVPRILEERER